MPTQVQIRGTTQATQEGRTLVSRELDVNTTDDRIAVHDGSTAGGIPHINYRDHLGQEYTFANAAGTDTITLSLAIAPAAYANGQAFKFKAAATNTGSATLNVDSLGAKTIKKKDVDGGTIAVLSAGDIISGGIYTVYYDGTDMILESVDSGGGGGDWTNQTAVTLSGTGTVLTSTVPSGIVDFEVLIEQMSFNATQDVLLRLGDSGGIETSGYRGVSDNGTTIVANSNALRFEMGAASTVWDGFVRGRLVDAAANIWSLESFIYDDSNTLISRAFATKSLSGELTQIDTTRASASGNFDAGTTVFRSK